MPYYAEGPLANDVITIEQVVYAVAVGDLAAVTTGRGRSDVSALAGDNANALVGRQLDVSTPATPALVAVVSGVADRRAEWLQRIGEAYIAWMTSGQVWWPTTTLTAADRRRAYDVLNTEIPNWAGAVARIAAEVAAGRSYTTMTVAQIEALIQHVEALVDIQLPAAGSFPATRGIVSRWYRVGKSLDLSEGTTSLPVGQRRIELPIAGYFTPGPAGRGATLYANPNEVVNRLTNLVYTDAFQVQGGIVVPRTPDYGWIAIPMDLPSAETDTFDPESPA